MSFSDNTIDHLTNIFNLPTTKERAVYAANLARNLDPSDNDAHELIHAMETAMRLSGDKHLAVRLMIDAAMATRLNINELSEDDKEKILVILAVLFTAPDEVVHSFIEKAEPDILKVYNVYHMTKELNDLLGEFGVQDS